MDNYTFSERSTHELKLNKSGGHYKREHCWGHMILEVAGFAHMHPTAAVQSYMLDLLNISPILETWGENGRKTVNHNLYTKQQIGLGLLYMSWSNLRRPAFNLKGGGGGAVVFVADK